MSLLDFGRIPWRKLHTAPPPALKADWVNLSWQARGMYWLLLSAADRQGLIALGRLGLQAVAGLIGGAWSDVEPAIMALIASGWAEHNQDLLQLRLPYYEASQTAITPAGERQRRHRQKVDCDDNASDPSATKRDCHAAITPEPEQGRDNRNAVTGRIENREYKNRDHNDTISVTPEILGETSISLAGESSHPPRDSHTSVTQSGQVALLPDEPKRQAPARQTRASTKPEAPTNATWEAYAGAHELRYRTRPLRNKKLNGQLAQLVAQLGGEAPDVAAFYVRHNAAFYVQSGHSVGVLLRDAQKLRTEMVTGRTINATTARQNEKTASNPFFRMATERLQEERKGVIDHE